MFTEMYGWLKKTDSTADSQNDDRQNKLHFPYRNVNWKPQHSLYTTLNCQLNQTDGTADIQLNDRHTVTAS